MKRQEFKYALVSVRVMGVGNTPEAAIQDGLKYGGQPDDPVFPISELAAMGVSAFGDEGDPPQFTIVKGVVRCRMAHVRVEEKSLAEAEAEGCPVKRSEWLRVKREKAGRK